MPWRPGVSQNGYVAGLTPAEEQMIEQVYLVEGIGEGQHALFHRLRERHGNAAPTRKDIADWLKGQPSYQIARMPKKDVTVAPVIPPPFPLSRVFADTMVMPNTAHNGGPGVGFKVYRAIVVYIDALTKFGHLHGVFQLVNGRPQSQQTRDGAIEFINRARVAANDPNLHVRRFVTDKGSEWLGAFEAWRAQEEVTHAPNYQITKTPGTRSSYNSIAERAIQSIRRLFHSRYRAVKFDWDMRNVPQAQRRFDWMAHISDVEIMWNSKYHSTIKATANAAMDPAVPPDYNELARRIRARAAQRYGNRAVMDGAAQPGFSAAGVLQVNQLVRIKRWKDSGGTASLKFGRIDNKTADTNYSEQIYRIRTVFPGRGMTLTTYQLETLDGDDVNSKWSRQQLLAIPDETLDNLTSDSDEDDEDDDDEEDDGAVADPEPRPPRGDDYRYRAGDRLLFAGRFFQGTPLSNEHRLGTVVWRRVRAFQGTPPIKSYRIVFPGIAPVDYARDEVDDDDDVQFAGR